MRSHKNGEEFVMRFRSLSALLAAAMTVVCFTGCIEKSNGGAGAGATIAEANTRMVADAAIAYGMKEKDFNDVYDIMVEYDKVYPGYGFAKHKGYGTKDHYAAIRESGMTPIHRRSFLKVIH